MTSLAIYVVMASRDEVHSCDYPICYFPDREVADDYARRATERAASAEPRVRSYAADYDRQEEDGKRSMADLDPAWQPGIERATTYSVAVVPWGKLQEVADVGARLLVDPPDVGGAATAGALTMDRLQLNKKDSETVRRWAQRNKMSTTRIIAWLVKYERERQKTGPSIADCIDID